ncbi:hypothetical protein OSB04_005868 [Centaurea solstitialis]|uniref:Flavin-containing monooxygenase n=1 Tax=Centaurea solstitialis TaxID=347529 RepID=A0AA38U1H5_9ASTR|nr:hypothetical protein OSB04_005868 [Centaurea solstitialis]
MIIGAGISGLLACKYCLSKGFNPIVFESQADIGGVWAKTIKTTKLQSFKGSFQFSDFSWPSSVTEDHPTQHQLLDYLKSYATHFDLMNHIQLKSVVKGIEYHGPSPQETFPQGKWKVTVENNQSTKVHDADFVMLCMGKFKDLPNIPEFAPGTGPEVFAGKVIHSMEYAAMDHEQAEEFFKGKRVRYPRPHWAQTNPRQFWAEARLLKHDNFNFLLKPNPAYAHKNNHLQTPERLDHRWGISKFVETHVKRKTPIAKFDMVPKNAFSKDLRSGLVSIISEDFFNRVERGSILLKKSPGFSFCKDGFLIDGENKPIQTDIAILATGFKGIQKLQNIFVSQDFRDYIAHSQNSRVPLYRWGWVVELLDGKFKLPSIKEMEKDISYWDKYMKEYAGDIILYHGPQNAKLSAEVEVLWWRKLVGYKIYSSSSALRKKPLSCIVITYQQSTSLATRSNIIEDRYTFRPQEGFTFKDFAKPHGSKLEFSLPKKKQVVIIGAGISGLLACKYCLSKGFDPIVFESQADIGGVWVKTIKNTRLQSFKGAFQFSDFPWPSSAENYPTQHQLLDYLKSYATRFDLMNHIQLNSMVKGIEYHGPSLQETFPQGKWKVTVENGQSTKVHDADFVILCVGRFTDFPNVPEFDHGAGPEVFGGKLIHSMEYAAMDHDRAEEFVKGKRVVVVGFQKQALDIAMECSSYYRKGSVDDVACEQKKLHEPVRWGFSKLVETHVKKKIPIAKFDMVPKSSFAKDLRSGLVSAISEDFFNRLETGSILLKKSPGFRFCEDGILIDGENKQTQADIVILATGFKGIQKLQNVFVSQDFRDFIAPSPDSRVPLYRECIPPRIPQVAIIGFSESISNLFTSEMRCRWVEELLDGKFKLPSIKEMEKDISNWDRYMKESAGEYHQRSSIAALDIWYNDQLCKDMGWNHRRKNGQRLVRPIT